MIYAFYTIHVIVCFFLILVVLLQQGKGADLSVFGGGSTQTAFGARSAATLLHKLTVVSFIVFILTTMSIAVLKAGPGGSTVMGEGLEEQLEESVTPPDAEELEAEAAAGEGEPPVEAPQAPVPAPDDDDPTTPVESLEGAAEEPSPPAAEPAEPPAGDEDGGAR